MNKKQAIIIALSIVAAVGIVSSAVIVHNRRNSIPIIRQQHPVTKAELAKADGKNGHECLVAVDGNVYQITDSAFWHNGKHTPSNGQAYCGADLSKVIDKAPHGRGILRILPEVGQLIN